MKKICTLILVLAMLAPLGTIGVRGAESTYTESPFYGLGWSDFNNLKYPYLEGLVTSSFSNQGGNASLSYNGAKLLYGHYTDEDVDQFAQEMKKTMDARPEGLRYWHLFGPSKIIKLKPENAIYLDWSIDQMKDLVSAVLKRYSQIGGKLDGLVVDTEYTGMSSSSVNSAAKSDPLLYNKIVTDPRYATEVRPLLEERGFPFFPNVTDYTPEIFPIVSDASAKSIWDTVMRNRLNLYVNEWAFDPLMEYFPDATLSDYQSMDAYAWLKGIAITDDGQNYSGGGNSVKSGNVSCFSFYFARPTKNFYNDLDNYVSFNDALYEASAFNTLLFDINLVRRMYESTDTHMIAPWITAYVYNDQKNGTLANTPYYAEQILHLGMLDPEPFLVYMYVGEYSGDEWDASCLTLNELLAELTRVAGYSDRKAIPLPQYWNSEYVLSGMYAGGRNIWRISPNTDEISLEDFLVDGTDPTFRVKGQTVTFPGGKILETASISNVGTCGYWVETAADVTPIVENDPDRFARYPSLNIHFEDQAVGEFTTGSALPKTAWEVTALNSDGSAAIRSADGNKKLALTGSVAVKSLKLPNNITAGDHYAREQDWYITVTVPEDLSASADVRLLSYSGHIQRVTDFGFRISGGKLYYGALAEGKEVVFEELADLPAGTYLLRRAMDFRNADAFACDYYVYDSQGNELAAAKDIPAPVFDYIASINFSSIDADKSVLLDNYTITLTGSVADFELFDAKTGMIVTDITTARETSTAYRLSWLNATDTTRTATVMAAIYEGDTLKEERIIKQVELRPGYDGVETGIVEIAEGQMVAVYLQMTEPSAKGGINPMIYLVLGAVFAGALLIAVALVATKPKKK